MTIVSEIRGRVLHVTFGLLYNRLAFLHEATGRLAHGPAWDRRRRHVLPAEGSGPILDLGCGEGRLLATIAEGGALALGIEPSTAMARRAHANNVVVVQATAQALPLQSTTIGHVMATYPGPWIVDRAIWDELARVTAPGATLSLLLGGDVRRGRGSLFRRAVLRLAYGRAEGRVRQLPPLGHPQFTGGYMLVDDEWGQAIIWSGTRDESGW